MGQKILVTSALLYANGPLHFGHIAGAYLPADCFSRFMRLKQHDIIFISGSDEYGMAITLSAELANRSPKEHVDIFHELNMALFKRLNIDFDHYSRTTTDAHAKLTQEFFLNLKKNGFIEEKVTEQLYSPSENRFLADRYVEGTCPKCGYEEARGDECPGCGASYEATDLKDPKSKLSRQPLTKKLTNHWFLRLDLFKDDLTKLLNKSEWRSNVKNFITPYIKELRPRSITRDIEWGVKVPLKEAEGKVLYVWFDAPIGYISATKEWAEKVGRPDAWRDYWQDPDVRLVHFIGKDNIVFHSSIFPAMLMGHDADWTLVNDLPANEFLMLEGRQFSKSSNWYIDLQEFIENYDPETLRYTLMANAPESQDADFTWKDFLMRVNGELVGKWGNLCYRSLVFINSRMDQTIPPLGGLDETDNAFLSRIEELILQAAQNYESFSMRRAAATMVELASLGNTYFDAKKPWELVKDKQTTEALNTSMHCCMLCLKALALISYPIIPTASEKLWSMLGFNRKLTEMGSWDQLATLELQAETPLPKPEILFGKLDEEQIEKEIEKLEANAPREKKGDHSPLLPLVSFDKFTELDLRVAEIEQAEPVPKSKRLLKLRVNLGFEKRTIVSGIAAHFERPQDLVGKRVVIVANLKPAKLMGITSEGMILSAGEAALELPELKNAKPGDRVR